MSTQAGIPVYDDPNNVPPGSFGLEIRGYINAATSGTYLFQLYGTQGNVYIWTGATALSGWTSTNRGFFASTFVNNGNPQTYPVNLNQGVLPFRVSYGVSGNQNYEMLLGLYSPAGTQIDIQGGLTPYDQNYPCDGSVPNFPPYGSE